MNEQIEQLAVEAEFSEKDLHIQGDNFQKFAELLIKKCASLVVDDYVILEYFGVQE